MDLPDLNCVISKEVVPLELEVTTLGVESQHHPVIVQELLLRLDSSAAEFFLQELQELRVFLRRDWLLRDCEFILWACLSISLFLIDVL